MATYSDSHRDILAAVICGTPLTNPQSSTLFKKSGLIHLIVVSGSHLILISNLSALFIRRKTSLLILTAYAVITGLQPPVLRALLHIALTSWFESQVFNIHPLAKELLTVLALLFLFPHYASSLSLCLSSLCALALQLTNQKNILFQSCAVFLFVCPCLILFSSPNLYSIVMNATVGAFLSATLLPAALLALLPVSFFSTLFSHLITTTLRSADSLPTIHLKITPWIHTQWVTFVYLAILIILVDTTVSPRQGSHV